MLENALLIIAGLALLMAGAEGMVRGAGSLAIRLGITPLVVGLTVVAVGTGSPELFLGIQAAFAGNTGIALGNIVGSNISNIALVLGVAAIVRPMDVRSELVRREAPLMIGATLLFIALLLDGTLSRLDGVFLLAGAVAYTLFAYAGARRRERETPSRGLDEALPAPPRPAWRDWVLLGLGLAALLVGAGMLLAGAVEAATELGVSEVVIGLTAIAIGTSLPELATSVTATLRDQADVAFGNAIGSNTLNVLFVMGVVALVHPIEMVGLRTLDLAVLIGAAVLVLPLMARRAVLNRWEGAILLSGYAVYVVTLVR